MRLTAVAALCAAAAPTGVGAQAASSQPWIRLGGQAIPILTRSNAVPGSVTTAEARLAQPVMMLQAGAWENRVRLDAMADVEGWTMPNGELTTGAYGEGYYDRRHSHTYAHELMLVLPDVLRDLGRPVRLTLAAGKGFAPFGTDDPMSRPPLLYPVNHHLSQVLERAVGVAAVQGWANRVTLEGGLFKAMSRNIRGSGPTGAGSATPGRHGSPWRRSAAWNGRARGPTCIPP